MTGAGRLSVVKTVGAVERVEVPAGTYRAIRVDTAVPEPDGTSRRLYTEWYAPGVGLVRGQVGKAEQVLKAFTPG